MMIDTLKVRIDNLKNKFQLFFEDKNHNITLETVPIDIINKLKSNNDFPLDLLLILENIGVMKNWGYSGCAMIDWWVPTSIENAFIENRCVYELRDTNFIAPDNLLFFAWDCDAKCYLYDTSIKPWKLLICDGLSVSMFNEDPSFKDQGITNGIVDTYEDKDSPDLISIIERWINI